MPTNHAADRGRSTEATLSPLATDRRGESRASAAFSFWIESVAARGRRSAWMLETSTSGAAFLIAAHDAPLTGELLELHPMRCGLASVDELAPVLPRRARVMRVDEPRGETRRVAIRFEVGPSAALSPHSVWLDRAAIRRLRNSRSEVLSFNRPASGDLTAACARL